MAGARGGRAVAEGWRDWRAGDEKRSPPSGEWIAGWRERSPACCARGRGSWRARRPRLASPRRRVARPLEPPPQPERRPADGAAASGQPARDRGGRGAPVERVPAAVSPGGTRAERARLRAARTSTCSPRQGQQRRLHDQGGARRRLAPARDRARRFRRARRDRRRQARAPSSPCSSSSRRPVTRAARVHQPRRRHRPLALRAVGARRRGARPQRDRHRAAQRAARHRLPARDFRERAVPGSAARLCLASARTSAASRSPSTSPACRIS